jgi:hypothetical protein
MKLYHVTSRVKEYDGHKDVQFSWFLWDRRAQPVAPYPDLISDYATLDEDAREYAQVLVDEMFTDDEARLLLAWLNEHREGVHSLGETTMPVSARNEDGRSYRSMIPVDGTGWPQGWLKPKPDWDLPFSVAGYYDLSRHDRVDGTHPAQKQLRSVSEIAF